MERGRVVIGLFSPRDGIITIRGYEDEEVYISPAFAFWTGGTGRDAWWFPGIPAGSWLSYGALRHLGRIKRAQEWWREIRSRVRVLVSPETGFQVVKVSGRPYLIRWTNNGLEFCSEVPLEDAPAVLLAVSVPEEKKEKGEEEICESCGDE